VIERNALEGAAPEEPATDEGPLEVEAEALAECRSFGHERPDTAERQLGPESPESSRPENLVARDAAAITYRPRLVAPARGLRARSDAVEIHPLVIPEPRERQHMVRRECDVGPAQCVTVAIGEIGVQYGDRSGSVYGPAGYQ